MKKIKNSLLASVFFISMAALMLEITLIRLLTLTYSYNIAMLVVSISLFGMASGAGLVYIKKIKNPVYICSLLFAATSILGYYLSSLIYFDPVEASYNYMHAFNLVIYYLLFSIPFFFFGIILSYTFKKYKKESGKLYFYNLSGSALGSISALTAINFFGQYSLLVSSFLAVIAGFFSSGKKYQNLILVLLFLFLFLVPLPVNISIHKEFSSALNVPGSSLLYSMWNSFSRIDVVNSSYTRYAPGLSLAYNRNLPLQLGLLTDGTGMTALTEKQNYEFTEYLPSYIGYELVESPKVLLINPKAGPDIIAAIKNSAETDIVEYNPMVISIAEYFKDFSGEIYKDANIIKEHGRTHAKKSGNYDIIIISLSGNVHGSNIYGLSQDYDLTYEGLKDYYGALNENGYLIITRWLSYPPKETLRLFYLAREVADENNIIMFRSLSTITLVIAKNPDFEKILRFTEDKQFDIVFMDYDFTPNAHLRFEEPIYYNYIKEIRNNKDFQKNYIFDVSAVTDDRPFYFNFFKLEKMNELHNIMGRNWQPFTDHGFLMFLLLAQSFVLCGIFIFLPMILRFSLPKKNIFYFLFIGISYMFVEINFIQAFVRLFGNITHSAAFVILIMLASSGFGSYISDKFNIKKAFLAVILMIGFFYFFLNRIITFLLQFDITIAIILSGIMIIPMAFFMGMPFPQGIKKTKSEDIPWAFAVNGASSVFSSIAALIIAIFFGFSIVLGIAALFYLSAYFFIRK